MKSSWRQRLLQFAILLFLVGGMTVLTVFNANKPRLVVVHSLSKASSWTAGVDQGIASALSASRLPVSVTVDHLDLDILSSEADLQVQSRRLMNRIDAIRPDVLLVVDDETSDLIGRHYAARGKPVVVYTGLIGDPAQYGYRASQSVFGIRELLPLQALVTVLEVVHGQKPLRLAVLGSSTPTGKAEMEQFLSHNWRPHEMVVSMLAADFEAWKTFVDGPAQQADVLVLLSMDNLSRTRYDGRSVPEAEVAKWTEIHSKPMPIGTQSSYVRLGGGLSVSPPPFEYGKRGAQLAIRLLENPGITPLEAHISLDAYDISLSQTTLAKRGVSLPKIYQEAARGAGQFYP
jgi:hypothetical protein